jgi:hypothetical protein
MTHTYTRAHLRIYHNRVCLHWHAHRGSDKLDKSTTLSGVHTHELLPQPSNLPIPNIRQSGTLDPLSWITVPNEVPLSRSLFSLSHTLSLSLSLSLALSGNMLQHETREREHTAKPAPCLAATWGQAARFSRALIHPTQGRSTCKTHRHPDTDTQTQTHMTFTTLAPRTLHKVCQTSEHQTRQHGYSHGRKSQI